jgi:hypothetical protein
MQEGDIQAVQVRLLRQDHMQQLHKELADGHQNTQNDDMQGLLEQHGEAQGLQVKEAGCSSAAEVSCT